MDEPEFDWTPNLAEMVLTTLEDFEVVASLGSGAILYPAPYRNLNRVGENLEAVALAATFGLSSVDYARRKYVQTDERPIERSPQSYYVVAYKAAREHIDRCANSMVTNEDAELGIGTFAASVALERLRSGFVAAHLLYNLGLNYEGDAVARQILEQIAWSVVASEVADQSKLKMVSSSRSISRLKALVPYAGALYGLLSQSVHAGHDQHAQVLLTDNTGAAKISVTWRRTSLSANIVLRLADLWVIAYEWTQRDHMTRFVSLDPEELFALKDQRPFLSVAQQKIKDVVRSEEASGSNP